MIEPRLRRRVAENFALRLIGCTIEAIERRGKYLLFQLSGGEYLLAHLGMTGALLLQPVGTPPQPHDHVRFRLSGGVQLTYNDPRRFGLLRAGALDELAELANVGPDPLAHDFSLDQLAALARGRKRPVKNLLMDQRALGGIGNIYANEILFRAGIRPSRPARRLTRRELSAFWQPHAPCSAAPFVTAAAQSRITATAKADPGISSCDCASTTAPASLAYAAGRRSGAQCTRAAAVSTARSVKNRLRCGRPSIRPLRKRGLLGANGFSDLFQQMLNRSPRVAAFPWRRIEGRICLSTLPRRGRGSRISAPPAPGTPRDGPRVPPCCPGKSA